MSSPDMELRSIKVISRPQSRHFVSEAFSGDVRRYRTVIQDGSFLSCSG
jgi:hypothetical protein